MDTLLPPLDYESILLTLVFAAMLFRTASAYRGAKRVGAVRTGLFGVGRTTHRSVDPAAFIRTMRQQLAVSVVLAILTAWSAFRAIASVLGAIG